METEQDQLLAKLTCPLCGTKLVKDTVVPGRYECGAWPGDYFRQPEFVGLPSCDYVFQLEELRRPWSSSRGWVKS